MALVSGGSTQSLDVCLRVQSRSLARAHLIVNPGNCPGLILCGGRGESVCQQHVQSPRSPATAKKAGGVTHMPAVVQRFYRSRGDSHTLLRLMPLRFLQLLRARGPWEPAVLAGLPQFNQLAKVVFSLRLRWRRAVVLKYTRRVVLTPKHPPLHGRVGLHVCRHVAACRRPKSAACRRVDQRSRRVGCTCVRLPHF